MSEENSDDVKVQEKDLEAIEKSILDKDKAKEDALTEKIEQKLKKEMEEKQKIKDLEDKSKGAEELAKKKMEEIKELEEKHKLEIEELKKNTGSSKAIHNVNSPFKDNVQGENFNPMTMTDEQVKEHQQLSKEKFIEMLEEKGSDVSGLKKILN